MRASARLSVRELSNLDLHLYSRVLPKKSLLLDCLKWIDWDQLATKLQTYYSQSGHGQPPYPPIILLKLEFLGYLYGMGRRRLIERASCDLHWKYFLGLPIDATLPDHSTLSYFRQRLGPQGFQECFDALIQQAREQGLVSDRLRLKDATHIYADIAVPTTLTLFAQLRQRMLDAVKAFDGEAFEMFEVALQEMHERTAGQSPEIRLEERVEFVKEILEWIVERDEPSDNAKAKAWQKLQQVRELAEKILFDQAHPENGDKTVSVFDADARCGKHGEYYYGYMVDVSMDAESELITTLEVLPANGDEARDAVYLIQAEEAAHGNDIEQLSIDGIGFHGEVLRALTNEEGPHVEVFTPPREFTTTEGYDSREFEPIDNGDRLRCPAGEVSGTAGRKADKPNTAYYSFSRAKCAKCPLVGECHPGFNPTGRTGRRVTKNEYEAEYAKAREISQTEEYAEVRRRHPAIERKLNEMVRHHRSRRAMYRGIGRVKIHQVMTAFSINIKRIVKLLGQQCAPTAQAGLA